MPTSRVQSVVLSKDRFDSKEAARSWVRRNGFKSGGIDETDESYRFRQFNPDLCRGRFRSKRLTRGVTVVLCVE